MKVSLIALVAGCAVASTAFSMTNSLPARAAVLDSTPTLPPRAAVLDSTPTLPPRQI
jgi:hypothetical protein